MPDYQIFDPHKPKHSKILNRSICMPSLAQAYSLCIEYMREWFYSKFNYPSDQIFKSEYIDGKYIFDEFRTLSKLELLKRQKPSLTITPTIDWEFDNEKIDSYPYGLSLYTMTGKFKNAFFNDALHDVYLGMNMETLLMRFTFRVRVETRAQQLDMYKYMRVAHRVGFSDVRDVDMDFHVPYPMMIQLAKDLGYDTTVNTNGYETINDVVAFLKYLNLHSQIPFLYKHRTINGKHEFFLRMQRMPVNIRPTDISADDGEREGMLTNNYNIELNCEVRFPAPRMYAYYSKGEHNLSKVYTSWENHDGNPVTMYTFKAIPINENNKYGWPLYLKTEYEQSIHEKGTNLVMDMSALIQKDIGECIQNCFDQGISPAIFLDLLVINGGEVVTGTMDWETFTFTSNNPPRDLHSFVGIYVDTNYLNTFIGNKRGFYEDRVAESRHPEGMQETNKRDNEKV